MHQLVLEDWAGRVRRLTLGGLASRTEGVFDVGSAKDNDIVLPWRGVSRHHARLRRGEGTFILEDRGSKNGLWADGEKIREVLMPPGRVVQIGHGFLNLEETSASEARLGLRLDSSLILPSGPLPAPTEEVGLLGSPGAEAELAFPDKMIKTRSRALRRSHVALSRAVRVDLPILILGPSGVGKELYARTIHDSGSRCGGKFVAVQINCIPSELFESELFGVEKATATGVAAREGFVRQADGGTLFLDEIADVPLAAQSKLLRLLQERSLRPVGARREIQVDFGLVAATHKDLEEEVAAGRFREDLYFRLAGFTFHVPPLADRREDIPELAAHFARQAARKLQIRVRGFSEGALRRLCAEPWDGNVRVLRSRILSAVSSLRDGDTLQSSHFRWSTEAHSPLAPEQDIAQTEPELPPTLIEVERRAIQAVLRYTRGNRSQAAKILGISRTGLRMKMSRLGIETKTDLHVE